MSPDGPTVKSRFANPAALINLLLPNLFVVAGILLLFFTVGAGFQIITNPADKKAQEEGSKRIGYAIGGFVLLFISYWIVQIIERVLGIPILGGAQ